MGQVSFEMRKFAIKCFLGVRGRSKSRPSIYSDAADKSEVVAKALFTACPRERLLAK